jgi:hypothetical protein
MFDTPGNLYVVPNASPAAELLQYISDFSLLHRNVIYLNYVTVSTLPKTGTGNNNMPYKNFSID